MLSIRQDLPVNRTYTFVCKYTTLQIYFYSKHFGLDWVYYESKRFALSRDQQWSEERRVAELSSNFGYDVYKQGSKEGELCDLTECHASKIYRALQVRKILEWMDGTKCFIHMNLELLQLFNCWKERIRLDGNLLIQTNFNEIQIASELHITTAKESHLITHYFEVFIRIEHNTKHHWIR